MEEWKDLGIRKGIIIFCYWIAKMVVKEIGIAFNMLFDVDNIRRNRYLWWDLNC